MENEGLDNPGIGVRVSAVLKRFDEETLEKHQIRRLVTNLIDDGLISSVAALCTWGSRIPRTSP